MVYFLGDWGMGDSDCASYHQHVPNAIQQQFHQHHQHHEQQQQQHVGQIAPNLNQLSPIQFGSTTGSTTFLSHSVDTHSTTTTATTSASTTTQPPQNVASSSLVTANLQQLSVSSNNLSHCVDTPLKTLAAVNTELNLQSHQQQPQQSHPLASAAAALHQYLGHQRQRSESCANFTTAAIAASVKTKNVDTTIINNANNINSALIGKSNCSINIKTHLGSTITSLQQLQPQLSKDHLESEDEVALQPLSNQVSLISFNSVLIKFH